MIVLHKRRSGSEIGSLWLKDVPHRHPGNKQWIVNCLRNRQNGTYCDALHFLIHAGVNDRKNNNGILIVLRNKQKGQGCIVRDFGGHPRAGFSVQATKQGSCIVCNSQQIGTECEIAWTW